MIYPYSYVKGQHNHHGNPRPSIALTLDIWQLDVCMIVVQNNVCFIIQTQQCWLRCRDARSRPPTHNWDEQVLVKLMALW